MKLSRWRLVLYELLTQTIVVLGCLRRHLVEYQPQKRRTDRLFAVYADERWACCDCGLEHDQVFTGPGGCLAHPCPGAPDGSLPEVGHAWPMRPVGYSYRFRVGAEPPSLAEG